MNVLKRLIIPKIELTIRYILSELEELEREDTFRLKRVKEKKMQKAKGDGAEEKIDVTDVVEHKKEIEETKHVAEPTPAVESKELSIIAEPKEAAEMGDLIIIKPPDDRMEGDVFIPPPVIKTMATITEVEELLDGMSDFDEKKKNKEAKEKLSADKDIQATVDDVKYDGPNLETGEWFETPSKLAHSAKLDENVSEYNKMDKFEEVLEDEMDTYDTAAVKNPLKADTSVMDLDKRALASFYKGLDSNFYKPTIDDIFSKHDIAMNDSLSLQDISMLDHSLVDLESIDFSIDSKGKVIFSRHDTKQSSPVLSTREVDVSKQMAIYNEDGLLIGTKIPSVRWPGEEMTENIRLESQIENEVDSEHINVNLDIDNVESIREGIDDVIQDSVSNKNVIKTVAEGAAFNEKMNDLVTDENKIETGIADDEIKLNKSLGENLDNKSMVSIEETEVWTSDKEQIRKDLIPKEFKSAQVTKDKNMSLGTKISRSVSDEKLSRISEEDNVETNNSNLITLTEEPKEVHIEEEKNTDSSIVSDKFENSKSSFHENVKLSASKMDTSQSITSIKNKNINDVQKLSLIDNHKRLDIHNNVSEMKPQEDITPSKMVEATDAEPEVFKETGQLRRQSYLEINDVLEDKLKPVRSARSSRDLQRDKDQNESSKNSIAEVNNSAEMSQPQNSKLYVKRKRKRKTRRESNDFDTNVKLSMEKVDVKKKLSNDDSSHDNMRENESQDDLQISKSSLDKIAGFESKTEKESQNLIRTVKNTALKDSDELEPLIIKDRDSNSSKTTKKSHRSSQEKRESEAKSKTVIEVEKKEDSKEIIKAESETRRDSKGSKLKKESWNDVKNSDMVEQTKRNSQIKRQSELKYTKETESKENVLTEENIRTSKSSEPKEYLNKNNLNIAKDAIVKALSNESKHEKPLNIQDTHEINETVNGTSKTKIERQSSETKEHAKRSSHDKHQNEMTDTVAKTKSQIKDIAIDESHDTINIKSKSLNIRDSNEILKTRRYSTKGQINIHTYVERQREIDKHERETDITRRNEADLKENKNKPLRIHSSDEISQPEPKNKEISQEERPEKDKEMNDQKSVSERRKEAYLKENENKPLKIQDSDEKIQPEPENKVESTGKDKEESVKEDSEQTSDSVRSSSGMNKPGKRHCGDDHLKQD